MPSHEMSLNSAPLVDTFSTGPYNLCIRPRALSSVGMSATLTR
jgi:hypothetical protein